MTNKAQIKLESSSKWHGADRWAWEVWVNGPSDRLDEISHVDYILHPTFANPVRRISDRATQFKLSSRGWGEFMIHAKIATKDNEILQLDHWLKLDDRSKSGHSRGLADKKPVVFLSYSRADYPLAAALTRLLESRQVEVITNQELVMGESIAAAVKSLIARVDVLVGLIAEEPSRWVLYEIAQAAMQQVAIVPVLLGQCAILPDVISEHAAVRIGNPQDTHEVLNAIEQQLTRRAAIVRKTVVELVLVGYGPISDGLEEGLGVRTVAQLNQQIQGFIDLGLASVNVTRDNGVMATTGDGAILVFDTSALAHQFARVVHEASRQHNQACKVPIADRHFRIGAATGEIVMKPKLTGGFEIAGMTIARAVRLETKASPGGLLVDPVTFGDLPLDLRRAYSPKEIITGKRDENFEAHACLFNSDGPEGAAILIAKASKKHPVPNEAKHFGHDAWREVLARFGRLKSDQYSYLVCLLGVPIDQRPPETLPLGDRKLAIVGWAEEHDELDLLIDVLRERTEPENGNKTVNT